MFLIVEDRDEDIEMIEQFEKGRFLEDSDCVGGAITPLRKCCIEGRPAKSMISISFVSFHCSKDKDA